MTTPNIPEVTLPVRQPAVTEVEIARSGTFIGQNYARFEASPEVLADLAATFDRLESHYLRIGHEPRSAADDTFYGSVLDLCYDRGPDRLVARILPTPALVEKNKKYGFRRVSMELVPRGGRLRFQHLAFLAAARPAISGLTPVHLAAGDGTGPAVRMAECDLPPKVAFAPSDLHGRVLAHLVELRDARPTAPYTEALEAVAWADAGVSRDGLSRRVEFAPSEAHDRVLLRLASMRKARPTATYTEAFEAVSAIGALGKVEALAAATAKAAAALNSLDGGGDGAANSGSAGF